MRDDEIDEIFSGEAGIAPSSGFVSGVMEAVRLEAAAPPPIPFPWARALPGMVVVVLALVAVMVVIARSWGGRAVTGGGVVETMRQALDSARVYGVDWILLAILVSTICMVASMRFVAGHRRTF